MKIREYLFRNNMTQAEFSRLLGINDNYFRMITRGIARPGYELCIKIEMLSGGQIRLEDLRPDKKYLEDRFPIRQKESELQGDHSIDDRQKNTA
jgi:transcriptional regulator with XRE-family HTH domain